MIIIGVLAAAMLADLLVSWRWLPAHLSRGLPLYSRMFLADPASEWPLPDYELQAAFHSRIAPSVQFRSISCTEYAFREAGISAFRYVPMMHGILEWHYAGKCVTVRGYAYWSTLALLGLFVASLWTAPRPINVGTFLLLAALLLLFGTSYAIQAYTFKQIGKYSARRWSEIRTAYGADA